MDKSHYIDGNWIEGTGVKMFSVNPATGKEIWEGHQATVQEVQAATTAARAAFYDWSHLDLTTRINFLEDFKRRLEQHKETLAEAISMETGKPLWDSKTEVAAMMNKIAISIEAYQVRCPDVVKDHPSGKLITRHKPHGVLAVFGPFNFPAHLPGGHIVPALLAGNTIVFKPSELTPHVAGLTIKCWEEAGLPKGVINLIQGAKETGILLAQHSQIDGLLFTGSWQTGQKLSENLATTPQKILALEMGGNNPLIVSDISDIKAAAYLTIQSAFLTSGQRCTCARRLIILKGKQGDAFLGELVEMTKNLRIGPYTDAPEPFMGPVISAQAAQNLLKKQEELIAQGGRTILPLKQLPQGPAFLSPGLIDVSDISTILDEEVFGPLLQIIRTPNLESAIIEANQTKYGLVAGILTDNEMEYRQFYTQVRAGIVNWNTQLTGASSAAPFGGIGQSGNNRPSAFYAADYCAYPVASIESTLLTMPKTISPGISLS